MAEIQTKTCRCCGNSFRTFRVWLHTCYSCQFDMACHTADLDDMAAQAEAELPGPLLPHARRGVNLNQMHD